MIIQRPRYIEKIAPFIDRNIVKVLTGIRRSGKTVLLDLIREELRARGVPDSRLISVNCESNADPRVSDREYLYGLIRTAAGSDNGRIYVFLDEIQEVTGWERLVNACLIDFDIDIYITGSNARLLSGELATYLGGRYIEIPVYPFSFEEAVRAGQGDVESGDHHAAFLQYLQRGGLPFIYESGITGAAVRQYLSDVFDSILLKDVAQRHRVRDIEQLRRLILFLISGIGTTFSAASVTRYLKNERRSISNETLYNYIEYAREACFLHLAPREDVRGKRVLSFEEKIFVTDHGFREALFGSNQRDIQQVLENIVYMELLRRGWTVRIGKNGNTEVDFACENGGQRLYVQVSYLLAAASTIEREFSALETIPDQYPKLVLTMDRLEMSRNGIRHKNVADWLLEDWE